MLTKKVKRPRQKGGFYPSAMGYILHNGPLLLSAAMWQGSSLIKNSSKRLVSRRKELRENRSHGNRAQKTIRTKRK